MYLCRTQGAVGWGRGAHRSPGEGWVTGDPGDNCIPPPPGGARPVPSWLSHGGRRGVGRAIPCPGRRGWTRSPPKLRVSPGDPPLVSPPHHSEVTRPWAAVGVTDTPFLHLTPTRAYTQTHTSGHPTTHGHNDPPTHTHTHIRRTPSAHTGRQTYTNTHTEPPPP